MNRTSIEWTHRPGTVGLTWNPIRARSKETGKTGTFCTRCSPGCRECYASVINKRFGTGLEFTVPNLAKHEFFVSQKILGEPAKQKKPATIFVGDMFDLFHEAISDEFILDVWDVMNQCRQHTFQILTKRADRMQSFFSRLHLVLGGERDYFTLLTMPTLGGMPMPNRYTLPNAWIGVSVEDQQRANERIPYLLATPAKVRFLSIEPQLEDVNLRTILNIGPWQMIHQVICGGESGPEARVFNAEWAESLLEQCRDANVAFFMKQFGSRPAWPNDYWSGLTPPKLKDRKGGDPSEWPKRFRVREFPYAV